MATFESYDQGTPCYVELMTPDLEAAKSFYGGLFAWELADVPQGPDGIYTTVARGGASVAGMGGLPTEQSAHPAFWQVYLAVDDVDAVAAAVPAAGGTLNAGPFDVGDLGRMAEIEDPAGARINLWQAGSRVGTSVANEPGTPTWNELMTTDLGRALEFYRTLLGITSETVPMLGGEYTLLKVGDRQIAGAMQQEAEAGAGPPPHWNVYFNVESCDDSVARVVELGGEVLGQPFDMVGVGRMAVVTDPQGGSFSLMQDPPA
ncbi:MAG: VOC family protein [Nocardioides sp.]